MLSNVLLALAIIVSLGFIFTAIRWWRGARDSGVPGYVTTRRKGAMWWILAAAVLLWVAFGITKAQALGNTEPPAPPVCTCVEKCTEGEVNPDCPVCGAKGADLTQCVGKEPEPEEEFLEAVHLTDLQIQEFLDKHTLEFVTRSLAGEDREARVAAVTKLATERKVTPFTDPVDYPVGEWFPEWEQLLNKDLTVEQRLALQEKFLDALDQECISNIPFGIMMLEGMKEVPYIYRNNSDWIDGNLAILNQFYAGTWDGKADASLELASVPVLDDTFIGLDYLVVNQPNGLDSGLMVREQWARLVAKMSSVMRCYTLRMSGDMVVRRGTADISWCNPPVADNSLVRMVKDDEKDSLESIVLSAVAKSGTERVLIGINIYDSRLEIFTPGTPDTKTEEPPDTTTDEEQPKTYVVSRRAITESGAVLRETEAVKSGLKTGATVTVNPWSIDGYTLTGTKVGNTAVTAGTTTVTVAKSNILVTFIYKQDQIRTVDYTLYGEWGYYKNGAWNVLKGKTSLGQYAAGAWYSHTTHESFTGYTVVNATASGTMPASDHTVYFEYKPVTYQLTAEYGYYDSRNNWRILDTKDLGEYAYNEQYSHTAPRTVQGYEIVSNRTQSGRMPARDHVLYFEYDQGEYTLYARYGYYTSSGNWRDLIGQKTIGTYKAGAEYKVYPEKIGGWSPIDPYIKGTMPDDDHTIFFEYRKGNDGDGVKNPLDDPAHNGNANIGGGENQPSDGAGNIQTDKPPVTDYPSSGGSNGGSSGGGNTGTKEPDKNNDEHEGQSSGTGGKDQSITLPGANNDNDKPPATDTIPVDNSGTPATGGDGSKTDISDSYHDEEADMW